MVIEEPSLRNKRYVFQDRVHAAQLLSSKLEGYKGEECVVLAVPSGGVPVGKLLAKRLFTPFDIILVRKLQIPWNKEAGFGALSWDGDVVLNEALMRHVHLTDKDIEESIGHARAELERRMKKFRGDAPFSELRGKVVILVDDGLASGFTMLAAIRSVRKKEPRKVIVAVPTASTPALKLVEREADEVFCLNIRDEFMFAVADAYKEWHDLSDEEVISYLKEA